MTRARELGIRIGELEPGPLDTITTGRGGRGVHRLDPGALVELMRRYGRL